MVSICADSSRSRVVQMHVVEHRDTSDVYSYTSDMHCDTSDMHYDTSDVHCRFNGQLGFVVIDISLAMSWANDQHRC